MTKPSDLGMAARTPIGAWLLVTLACTKHIIHEANNFSPKHDTYAWEVMRGTWLQNSTHCTSLEQTPITLSILNKASSSREGHLSIQCYE